MASTSSQTLKIPPITNPIKVREDGELTSSEDDDVLLSGSNTGPPSLSSHPCSSVPNAIVRSSVQNFNSGKSSRTNILTGSAHNQSQSSGHLKGFSQNQALAKSNNLKWNASGANDNLVISFSDDDDDDNNSGSGGGKGRHAKALGIDRPPPVNRKPPSLPSVKLPNVRRPANREGKIAPKKMSLSRTFTSVTKTPAPNRRSGGPSFAEPRSCLRNSNVTDKFSGSQDPGFKDMGLSSTKLQDLRQQITLRENELKSRSMQQIKESVTEYCGKVNLMGDGKVSIKKSEAAPAYVHSEPHSEEPDRKRLKVDAPGVAVSCSLSDWISSPSEIVGRPKQTASVTYGAYADPSNKIISKHSGGVTTRTSRSASSQDRHDNYPNTVNDQCNIESGGKKVKSTSNSGMEARSMQVSDSKFESPDESPQNTGCVSRSMYLGSGDMDLQSLFENEELYDKELDEAQEHRRRCEVEERNALKAYRKAQRALGEANARTTHLYRRRELYSAWLRSLLMEDSSSYSSRLQNQFGEKWNLPNNGSEVNLELIPSNFQLQGDSGGAHQLRYDSNSQGVDEDGHNRFSENEVGQNMGSEACSEPDASTSELLGRGNISDANDFISPSIDPNLSPDGEFASFPLDHRSHPTDVTCVEKRDKTKEIEKDVGIDSATKFSIDSCRDPILLEKYLRSKLVSRLGVSSSSCSGDNRDAAAERIEEEGIVGAKTRMTVNTIPNVLTADRGDFLAEPEGIKSKTQLSMPDQQHIEANSFKGSVIQSSGPEANRFLSVDPSTSFILPWSIFTSAMQAAGPASSQYEQVGVEYCGSPTIFNDDDLLSTYNSDKLISEKEKFTEQLMENGAFGKIDSYTCRSAINPLWPLCMYELRGRCNNDECPWQHEKDYSSKNADKNDSSYNDCRAGWSLDCHNWMGKGKPPSVLSPPKYLLFLGCLKDMTHASGTPQARHFGSSQIFFFSLSLALSSRLLKPSDEPCLHGNEGSVESYCSSGHPLYFQKLLQNGMGDNDQSLEMALMTLNQEFNTHEGMKKALAVLVRALEADPSSLHIWIIYLLLYYSTNNEVGELSGKSPVWEDDLFSYAVKHNEQSYELWLFFINSRRQVKERLAAYERALARLCYHVSPDDEHVGYKSAAILDLFLQMLHCFCVSGNLAEAVQRIYSLIPVDRDFDESHSLLLCDIIQCLTVSDKCVFWVCCVYLVIYKKLPDSLVQQLEFEKDISSLEWSYVHLTLEEKQQVTKLIKVAMESVGLQFNSEPPESSTLKSAHMLVVNHIKLLEAIADEEERQIYLEKYRNDWSTCLDVVLLSARACGTANCKEFGVFEDALRNWSNDVPGNQCIWNQFASCALVKGIPDKAKEIMELWFQSVRKPQSVEQSGNAECVVKGTSEDSQIGLIMNALKSYSNMDLVFGLLNLSLYEVFQNKVLRAQSAIDKALEVADAEVLKHCLHEHAVFLFNNGSLLGKDTSVRGLLETLKGYSIRARDVASLGPLTRRFIQDIRKPRSRHLASNLLCPISPDSSLVNFILEIWFGSSLFPQKSDEIKELVDFVECILEVAPANYQVVISVVQYLCRDSTEFASVLFWASSLLVNTIYQAIPVPPEYVWVEAATLLCELTDVQELHERFHLRALSAHPFSIKLWRSYVNLSMDPSKKSSVIEEARRKGLEL